MQGLYALVVLVSLVAAAGSLPMLIWRRLRRKAALTLCISLILAASALVQFQRAAPLPGSGPRTVAATPYVPVAQSVDGPVQAPALEPEKPRRPGVARICLLDEDVKLKPADAIELPASTVFQDDGPNTGSAEDPDSWGYEAKEGFQRKAAIITLAPVTLKRGAVCATAPVKMYVAPLFEETAQVASDRHIFAIDDVIDYPIPTKRPPVEIGKLIDDISVKAILIDDVSDTVVADRGEPSDYARGVACLTGAKKLAAHVGGSVGRQTSSIVALGGVPAHEASYGCSFGPKQNPDLFASWDGSAKPPAATLAFIGRGGEFLTGATAAELTKETQTCVAAALKPDAMETAAREFRGAKIECQAFARDGGGGSVTVYRRFGAYPDRPEPAPESAARTEEASEKFKAESEAKEARGRASMQAFTAWWEDSSIPKDVKVFAMMSSRIIALEERCPTARSHGLKVATWASSAGVEPDDIAEGGRYHDLMVGVLSEMRAGALKESAQAACAALRKYD